MRIRETATLSYNQHIYSDPSSDLPTGHGLSFGLCREKDAASSSNRKGIRFQPSLSAVTEGSVDTQSSRSSLSSMAESPFQKASIQNLTQVGRHHKQVASIYSRVLL